MRHHVTSAATIPVPNMSERKTASWTKGSCRRFTHLSCLHLLLGLILPSMAEGVTLDHPDASEPIMKRDRTEKGT